MGWNGRLSDPLPNRRSQQLQVRETPAEGCPQQRAALSQSSDAGPRLDSPPRRGPAAPLPSPCFRPSALLAPTLKEVTEQRPVQRLPRRSHQPSKLRSSCLFGSSVCKALPLYLSILQREHLNLRDQRDLRRGTSCHEHPPAVPPGSWTAHAAPALPPSPGAPSAGPAPWRRSAPSSGARLTRAGL